MFKYFTFVGLALIAFVACSVHAQECLKIPKHYEELGCTVKDKDKDDCPTRSDCEFVL